MGRLSALNEDTPDVSREDLKYRLGQALLLLRRFYNGIEMSHLTMAEARAVKLAANYKSVGKGKECEFKSRDAARRQMEDYFRFSVVNGKLSYNLADDVYRFLSRVDKTFRETTLQRQYRFLARRRKETDHQRPCREMCPFKRDDGLTSVRVGRGEVPGDACPYFRQLHGFGVYCEPMMGKIEKLRNDAKAKRATPKKSCKCEKKAKTPKKDLPRVPTPEMGPQPLIDKKRAARAEKAAAAAKAQKKTTRVAERKRPAAAQLRPSRTKKK